jgi:hypothetical protein
MVACVLAGVGFARLVSLAGERLPRPRVGGVAVMSVVAAVALAAVTLPWSVPQVHGLIRAGGQANQAAHYQERLFSAVDRVGGRTIVLPCRSSVTAVNHSLASALAWKLQVPERRVRGGFGGTGYVFVTDRNRNTGNKPRIRRAATKSVRDVLSLPPWRVLLVRRLGAVGPPRCKPHTRTS